MNTSASARLIDGLRQGQLRALARLITWAETGHPELQGVMREIFSGTGAAHRLGITGPPGAGKSTVIDRLLTRLRGRGRRVGIAAVDPSSPFTGGALLGDRIRMKGATGDTGVFVRSMATRGSLGGLAGATEDALDLMEAAGFDQLVVETVGVGQIELDVARATHTVIVVLVPESGDGVQAMKAGLMEIGDVFAVNKADREGADRLVKELESMLSLRPESEWRPPVLAVSAERDTGMDQLMDAVERHQAATAGDAGAVRRRAAARERVLNAARSLLLERGQTQANPIDDLVTAVVQRTLTPHDAARQLVDMEDGSHGP